MTDREKQLIKYGIELSSTSRECVRAIEGLLPLIYLKDKDLHEVIDDNIVEMSMSISSFEKQIEKFNNE